MNANAKDNQSDGTILLHAELHEVPAIPGSEVKISLSINNPSQESEFLELSVQGVPTNWVSLPSPVISLAGGEEKNIDLILQIPPTPEIRAGTLPLKIAVTSQKDPAIKDEVEVQLAIAAFESQGRIGVMLKSVQFTVAPGGSLSVPLTILNRGLEADTFRLGVEGVPVSWVSTSTPVNPLKPGESKEVSLVIRPPLASSSPAGRNKFFVTVTSQAAPDQFVKVECILTIAAYMKFSATLEPQEVAAGQPVMISVKNEGNTQQVFHLHLANGDEQMVFELMPPEGVKQATGAAAPGSQSGIAPPPPTQIPPAGPGEQTADPTVLTVLPGESAAFRFTVHPRQRQFVGGPVTYSYHASVESQQKETKSFTGRVVGQGMIPVWALVVALVLCLGVIFTASFLLLRDRNQSAGATQTSAAETALAASVSQTVVANQTAAAIAGQQDTDGDGLTDQLEAEYKTAPTNPDTDGDISLDGNEVLLGTDPLNPDSDGDGLIDSIEIMPCPNPLNPDSDQDGIIDGKDLSPCDATNPALTTTTAALLPTITPIPPTTEATQPSADTPTTPPTGPSLPRFGGIILFESDRDGNPEIYNTDDAGHISRLTDNPAADTQPAWEPGLRRLAFTSNRDGQNEIYMMNADGTNPVNLTNNPADDQYPTWSIDGGWIAFSSNRDGNYEIYILNVSSLEVRNLTNNPANDTQPNWVRSKTLDAGGEFILFTSDRDGNQEIYRMKTDGADQLNLTGNPASDQMGKGSYNGEFVVFTTNRDGNQEIYTMTIDGQNPADLTNHPANDFSPCWSPDQEWITFTTERDGNREVYLIELDSLGLYNLTNHPNQDQVADWR
jgi:Tol biopolymer transport system component